MASPARQSRTLAAKEQAMVRQIVKQHLGGRVGRIDREGGGLSNLVYSVKHSAGEFIVRLNSDRAKLNPFLKEQWATARARKAGVPVAEILEVGNTPAPYMILRKSPGEPATSHPERKRIIRDLGGLAARINSIETQGFGATFDWTRNRLSVHPKWQEFLNTELELDPRLQVLKRLRMLPAKRLQTIRSVLRSACRKGRKPVLNHSDLRLKNVLVDGKGRISAVLDWENASSNLAPEWEFSLALHDLTIDEKQEFLSGYGLSPRVLAGVAQTVKALNIVNYVPELERLANGQAASMLELYRLRLGGAFDLYSL